MQQIGNDRRQQIRRLNLVCPDKPVGMNECNNGMDNNCLKFTTTYMGNVSREEVSLLGISEAAENIGFRSVGAKLTWQQLSEKAQLPFIIFWRQVHFVAVYRIKKDKVYIAAPAKDKGVGRLNNRGQPAWKDPLKYTTYPPKFSLSGSCRLSQNTSNSISWFLIL